MPTYPLSPTNKNAVLDAIQASGLDPLEFEWTERPTEAQQVGPGRAPILAPVLQHKPTGYWYAFDYEAERGNFWVVCVPGPQNRPHFKTNAGDWPFAFVTYFIPWLQAVRREYEAPDLWAALGREQKITGALSTAAVENTPFTEEERTQVATQLEELTTYLRETHELTTDQLGAIEARLKYLERATQRVGRVDWLNALVGSLVSLVLQAIIPADVIRDGFQFLASTLGHILFGGDARLELPGGPVTPT